MINTWKCDLCGEERPDRFITVLTYPLKNLLGGRRNLKYCNDKNECIEKAVAKAKTREI